jgi:hypothetical protein
MQRDNDAAIAVDRIRAGLLSEEQSDPSVVSKRRKIEQGEASKLSASELLVYRFASSFSIPGQLTRRLSS